jgi:putative ABC transport system substrate-binding protein
MRVIGLLQVRAVDDPQATRNAMTLKEELQKVGWIEGKNIRFDIRRVAGNIDRIPEFAKELVALNPDAIVVAGTAAAMALARETSTVPIVFLAVEDPVATGLVSSFARPGGNLTGFMTFNPELAGKWLEVLKEIVPHISRVAATFNPKSTAAYREIYLRALRTAARSYAVVLAELPIDEAAQIDSAVATCASTLCRLIVLPDNFTIAHRHAVVAAAAHHRVPAIYHFTDLVRIGGLVSYGDDWRERWQGAAAYVSKILHGERPGDLPVQAPNRFQLAVNLKTAKALGLTVPPTLLARADEVIE